MRFKLFNTPAQLKQFAILRGSETLVEFSLLHASACVSRSDLLLGSHQLALDSCRLLLLLLVVLLELVELLLKALAIR